VIELGEPVTVGAVHDDGVRERNVDAVFDDCGRDEDIELVIP